MLTTFSEADALTRSQREQSIALLAKTMGLPAPVIASYLDHRPPTTIKPLSAEVAALQQQTADLFYENRLVPKKSIFASASGSPLNWKENNYESEYVLVFYRPTVTGIIWERKKVHVRLITVICNKLRKRRIVWAIPVC